MLLAYLIEQGYKGNMSSRGAAIDTAQPPVARIINWMEETAPVPLFSPRS